MLSIVMSPDYLYSLKRWINHAVLFSPLLFSASFTVPSYDEARAEQKTQLLLKNFRFACCAALILCFVVFLFQVVGGYFLLNVSYRSFLGFEFVRVHSLFRDPNYFGAFLVFCTPFFVPAWKRGLWKDSVLYKNMQN